MPRDITFPAADYPKKHAGPDGSGVFPVATEEELIEFVNKGRKAGGADILSALIPSVPSIATQCLIANALNFSCAVECPPEGGGLVCKDGYRYKWAMVFPSNMSVETMQSIAHAYETEIETDECDTWIILPAHIGNAADAFDESLAFQNFILP